MTSATAFITVRNGGVYLERCVKHLVRNGIAVVVIDNDSSDTTPEVVRRLDADGLLSDRHHEPYLGYFDLTAQLALKRRLMLACASHWVLHVDVDEMPHSCRPGERLVETLGRAQQAGYSVINFDEFVFLPVDQDYPPIGDSFPPNHYYYFFEPRPMRLMRAWQRSLAPDHGESGGHTLRGEGLRVFPEAQVLRHYPFVSQQHAFEKYTERRFSTAELSKGWHRNRVGQQRDQFIFPARQLLQALDSPEQVLLDRSRPCRLHYWQWDDLH